MGPVGKGRVRIIMAELGEDFGAKVGDIGAPISTSTDQLVREEEMRLPASVQTDHSMTLIKRHVLVKMVCLSG